MPRVIIPALALTLLALPAAAQEMGGQQLAPQWAHGPKGIARQLLSAQPSVGAADVQANSGATDRLSQHQQMIANIRGDAGYLGGFLFGTPLSASVQRPANANSGPGIYVNGTYYPGGRRPVIINDPGGSVAVAVGNGNVIQQQQATGSGPIALQQVATLGTAAQARSGGAVNVVTGGGNIVQSAPQR